VVSAVSAFNAITTGGKKPKINIKKSNGLMPRGNTIDNRYAGPFQIQASMHQNQHNQYQNVAPMSNDTTNVAASHSTTVGVSSQNGSRPGSAVKKVQGTSPINQKKDHHQNLDQYKNLLFYSSKASTSGA
jgi:hypothetical protein